MNTDKPTWLDRPLLTTATLSREKTLYGLFIALALLSRLWDLGFRVMSHDETIHAQWSWYLYQGQGYQHTPLSHGPFLYHATALGYHLFGDNDVTARLVPALMGVILVVLPYAMRRWLGRAGALVASFLLLISPSLLYYSRYARHDVPIVVWALVAVWAMFGYLGGEGLKPPLPIPPALARGARGSAPGTKATSRPSPSHLRWRAVPGAPLQGLKPLPILAAALALMFATKEVSFIYIAIFGLFLVLLFFARLGATHGKSPAWEQWRGVLLTALGLVTVIILATGLLLLSLGVFELFPIRHRDCNQASVPGAVPGQMSCTQAGCQLVQGRCQRPLPVVANDAVIEFDQTGDRVAIRLTRLEVLVAVMLIGAVTMMAVVGVYTVLERLMPFKGGENRTLDLILFVGSFTLPSLSPLAINGLSRVASRSFFGINAAFDALDYSEVGLLRSTGFVFIFLAVSVAVGVWWDRRRWLPSAAVFYVIFGVLFTSVFTNGNGLASGTVGSLSYWLEQQSVERGSQPLYYYTLIVPLYEYLPLIGFIAAALYILKRNISNPPVPNQQNRILSTSLPSAFPFFLIFWTALTWIFYALAGERMPWLTVHFAAPMILTSGWIVGKLIEGTDWRVVWRKGGWLVVLVAPLSWAALVQTVSPWLKPGAIGPFSGHSVSQWNATNQFLTALFVLLVSLGVLYWVWERIGPAALGRILAGLGLLFLGVLTLRTAWAAAYINGDYAQEFLVFAHGTPDVRDVITQIEEISRRVSGERTLDVGYTAEDNYPYIWYLRRYPNAVQIPSSPSRQTLDKSTLIIADQVWAGIEPYLGDGYACNHYKRLWWPMEDYRNLDWERVRYALTNPEMRAAVWDIVFRRDYRRYEQATGKTLRPSQWPLRDGIRLCVRRDVLARMWDEKAKPVEVVFSVTDSGDETDYLGLEQVVTAELEIMSLGPSWGNLNSPHGVALDGDGFLYVADTDNHRIVKLSPEGEIVDAWDSTWWRGRNTWQPNGCLDESGQALARGDGEFCEPWDVAVGPDGRVYVADTWNHRIQAFTSDGRFLARVGAFGQSGDVSSAPAQFYGPRSVAVGQDGRVYVGDTGNKRVQVFDADLNHLFSFGGPGIAQGRLDEPVGLAIGSDDLIDLIYVADTWNQRAQAFTLDGDFLRAWPIAGWGGQSPFNKPYVAVDSAGRVYASDPEAARILVFDAESIPLAALRGGGSSYLQSPTGVALDAQGRLWVSDAAKHRLLRFPPLDLSPPD